MIARVEPLTSARALRGPFDYWLPEHLSDVGVGGMLLVPFGRRRVHGVVVEMAERSHVPAGRLVEPLDVLDHRVPPELVELGQWVAAEYCSTPARGLALVLPPGVGAGGRLPRGARRVLRAQLTAEGRSALASVEARLGRRQRAALEALSGGALAAAEACLAAGCGHDTFHRLAARGLVSLEQTEERRRPATPVVGRRCAAARLTGAQRSALTVIVAAMDSPADDHRLLLHGVTGSGKTEVYLRAAAAALERGRSAIVLVPEIALTPQAVGRFEARFGDAVGVLHSKLTAGERHEEWTRLRDGEARVAVGPRSAVFAPVRDLGLIVIDEEHDASYKQESDPRYDARRVAERRAAGSGAVLVAGSATPRPETFRRYERVRMPERVDGRSLPTVELVGMLGVPGPFHPTTRAALDEVRRRGEKAIVLLNRRGWSSFVSCGGCGRVWECPWCDVSLVLHRAEGRLACHHCGHAEQVPRGCTDCGSVSLSRHGTGTERLEPALAALVEPLPVFRLDSDTASRGGASAEVLRRFGAAPAGVLVGTQMVAKGHDFPDVTLGIVLDADATLRVPDFRAEERTFALVAQLAGRSGRGPRGGRVVVQALDPSARSLEAAARHDADGFLAGELARRDVLGYPPAAHLIRVVCASVEPGPERAATAAVGALVRESAAEAALLGPAPLFRRGGRERAQLVVKSPERVDARAAAVRAVDGAVQAVARDRAHRGVTFSVDVDPQ